MTEMTYEFRDKNKTAIASLLDNSIGDGLRLPDGPDPDVRVYFQNGDRMTVGMASGTMEWEPAMPGQMCTSRLSMRFHQWFGRGIIVLKTDT